MLRYVEFDGVLYRFESMDGAVRAVNEWPRARLVRASDAMRHFGRDRVYGDGWSLGEWEGLRYEFKPVTKSRLAAGSGAYEEAVVRA